MNGFLCEHRLEKQLMASQGMKGLCKRWCKAFYPPLTSADSAVSYWLLGLLFSLSEGKSDTYLKLNNPCWMSLWITAEE